MEIVTISLKSCHIKIIVVKVMYLSTVESKYHLANVITLTYYTAILSCKIIMVMIIKTVYNETSLLVSKNNM